MNSIQLSISLIGAFLYAGTALAIPMRSYNNVDVNVSAIIDFTDVARGSSLSFLNLSDDRREEVVVQTTAAESPASVRQKLADVILGSGLPKLMPSVLFPVDYNNDILREVWQSENAISIYGHQGEIVLGGTETGLGILPPVGSVSVAYDAGSKKYDFRWHEKSDYDEVYVRRLGKQRGGPALDARGLGDGIPFYTASHREYSEFGRRPYYVVGFRNGLPTNASYVIVDQFEQLDCFFGPFTNNITTNWTGWSSSEAAPITLEEKRFSEEWVAPQIESGATYSNHSAQIIRSDRSGARGGIYRSFIAQSAGNVYRPSIRYSVMEEAEDFQGAWALDIMVGTIEFIRSYELDEATRIREADAWSELESIAGQVRKWRLDHTMTPYGGWVTSQTGVDDSDTLQSDIQVGNEKLAIFMCVRLSGHKPNGIAMDSVRLTDVTENPQPDN